MSKEYQSKLKITKEELFNLVITQNKTDLEIGTSYGVTKAAIYLRRKKYNIFKDKKHNENEEIKLSQIQKEVMFGTLLGDGYMNLQNSDKNPSFSCNHSYKQKEYVDFKFSYFSNFKGRIFYFKRSPHKITKKEYETYTFTLNTNPSFHEFEKLFYINRLKSIPIKELATYYTPLAMAIHFMDDGSKDKPGYVLSTCSFSKEDITSFRIFLLSKYNIETSYMKSKKIYIKKCSVKIFTDLIKPYVIDSMCYKLHVVS